MQQEYDLLFQTRYKQSQS